MGNEQSQAGKIQKLHLDHAGLANHGGWFASSCLRVMPPYDIILHSPCWFLDIKFKEYSRSIQALKTEFSRSIQSKFTLSCTMFRNVFIGQ